MIVCEIKKPSGDIAPDEVEIYLDEDGLYHMILYLNKLRENKTDHIHMMSESWGGYDLSDQTKNKESLIVNHIKIYLTP